MSKYDGEKHKKYDGKNDGKSVVKTQKKVTSIPYVASELFFVFFESRSHSDKSDRKRTRRSGDKLAIIDGPHKAIGSILKHLKCKVNHNKYKENIVLCQKSMEKELIREFVKLHEQHVLKFEIVTSKKKQTTQIHKKYKTAIVHIHIGNENTNENENSNETLMVEIPSSEEDLWRNNQYSKYEGQEVQIIANNLDEVARVAKSMGIMLYAFVDRVDEFIANGVFIFIPLNL